MQAHSFFGLSNLYIYIYIYIYRERERDMGGIWIGILKWAQIHEMCGCICVCVTTSLVNICMLYLQIGHHIILVVHGSAFIFVLMYMCVHICTHHDCKLS